MRDLFAWSLPLGRWAGVQLRLHAFFLVLGLLMWHHALVDGQSDLRWYFPLCFVALVVAALVHEVGHAVTAARFGIASDQIVLWPLGGLYYPSLPHQPAAELLTALAGPAVNLVLCLLSLLVLLVLDAPLAVFHPLRPPFADDVSAALVVALFYWTNGMLCLVNLLPATPFDGGRILRSLLWIRSGYRSAVSYTLTISRLLGLVLIALAVLGHTRYPYALMPLALVGIVMFFSARYDVDRGSEADSDENSLGYDFSQGYTSFERHYEPATPSRRSSLFREWLERRRRVRLERQRQLEDEEDRKVDEVLARLHAVGPEKLSPADQALLKRVAARYRNRHQ